MVSHVVLLTLADPVFPLFCKSKYLCEGGIDINFWFAAVITISISFLRKVYEF